MKHLTFILLMAITPITFADFLDAGEAYEQQNYSEALKQYQTLAQLGHHEAQHNLAVMYFLGQGIDKNPVQAYGWATLAKQSQDTKLQDLQLQIKDKLDVEQLAEAEQFADTLKQQYGAQVITEQLTPPEVKTEKQFEQMDNAVFQSSDYTLKPIKRSAPNYPRSALRDGVQGWVKASFEVHPDGSIRRPVIVDSYPEGVFDESTLKAFRSFRFNVDFEPGVEPYPVTATQTMQYHMGKDQKKYQNLYKKRIKALQKLADQGHPDAHFYLAMALDKHSPVTTASGEPADQVLINEHLFKAAQSGHIDAQYHLGNNLYSGEDGYQDKAKGARWLMLAAENGQAQAARRLFLIFNSNPEMNSTQHPAQYWLVQAAEQGDLDAKLNYAEWLADNGDSPEQYRQGIELLEDYADDRPETVLWYQTAATLNEKTGHDKKAEKYHKKADKLAKRMGWED